VLDRRWDDEPSPILCLPARAEDLPRVIPERLWWNVGYAKRRAERDGRARIERVRDERGLDKALATLFALHRARWEARGEKGVLCDANVQNFHRAAARGLLKRGLLRLYTLLWESRTAAVLYGFLWRERAYYYISGFDPSLERYSLGTLLIGHFLEEAAREGAREFDFLRGRESYKYRWGAVDRSTYGRTLRHIAPVPT
jgi:CelD/BcsL family acetyltransferase involved in cellulose biosynthesis